MSMQMNQPQEPIALYDLPRDENPHLTTLKAKYNACANKLNRNKKNPGTLSGAEEEELYQKLHVIRQLILAHEP
jgi:uncharacterized protein YdcH (DUF465 family)